jgi:TPR repeat protein
VLAPAAQSIHSSLKDEEPGDALSQFKLGLRYKDGQGVPKDLQQAFRRFRKAAIQGHAEAQFQLAVCYQEGLGVPKDPGEAAKWYRRAAERGQRQSK